MDPWIKISDEEKEALQNLWKLSIKRFLWDDIKIFEHNYNTNRIVTAISKNIKNNNKYKPLQFNGI